ncbi:ANR16-like protein [Mya arenaria]|uniref:ANR16-like protein n=1 Tax=Mya arenaria TaxID=6604 RepID=A0ABY7FVI8_MYAAR|nr:ANR16-like protein [Mya arenaria]
MSEISRAAQSGDLGYFREVYDKEVNISMVLEYFHDKSGDTAIHFAVRHGHLELVKFLLCKGFNLETGNFDGKRPLHEAAQAGQYECLVCLLDSGASVDSLKRADWTSLMLACTKDRLDIVKALLEHGARLKLKNKDGWNSFHVAVREGHLDIIEYLLNFDKTVWDTVSKNGRTPLHTAALHSHADVVSLLLERCDYVTDTQDSCGSTPLMDAIRVGCIQAADVLINNHEADITKEDNVGRQCLHVACQAGCLDSLVYLVDTSMDSPMKAASTLKHQLAALQNSDQNIEALDCHLSELGRACLSAEVEDSQYGHLQLLLRLSISEGVHTMFTTFSRNKWAQVQSTAQTIKSQLEADNSEPVISLMASPQAALHIASGAQHVDCVTVLLQQGADCVPDQTGSYPWELARKPAVIEAFSGVNQT